MMAFDRLGAHLRRGADPSIILIAFVCVAVFSNYVSSWLPPILSYPAGGVLRDFLAVGFLVVAFVCVRREAPPGGGRTTLLTRGEERVVAIVFLVLLPWVGAFFLADDRHEAALMAAKDLVLYVAVGVAVYVLLKRGLLSRRALGLTILFVGLGVAVLGIVDTATGARSLGWLGYDPDYANVPGLVIVGEAFDNLGQDRASGGVTNAVSLGYLLGVVAIFAAYRLLHEREESSRAVQLLEVTVLVCASLACVLTLTRGAILALALTMLILAMCAERVRDAVALLLVVAFVGLGVVWGSALHIGNTADIVERRLGNSDVTTQSSSAARRDELNYAYHTLPDRPLGTGLSSAGKAASRFGKDPRERLVLHSSFLALAFQIGLPGLLLFLVALAVLMWAALQSARQGGSGALALLVLFLAAGALAPGLADPTFGVPFLMSLALCLTVATASRARPGRSA